MSRKWIFILLGVVVLLVVIAIIKGGSSGSQKEVTVETVKRRSIVETVSASGKIQPETEVIISSDVSGEIIEMAVKEGDAVKRGDLLVKINPDLVESAMSRAAAALNTSKANLAGSKARLAQSEAQFVNAQASFQRNKKLFEDNVISQADYDNALSSFDVAKADVEAARESVEAARYNVKSAEATLKEAQDNLGRTSIYSPMDGIITKLNKEKGERVVGTAQMAGTEIMTVADLNVMEVAVEVNENDIVRVSLYDTTEIEVDAYLEEKFKGIVTEIANSANVVGMSADQVTNFDVRIRILASSYAQLLKDSSQVSPFRPGMSATVDIQTEKVSDALTVSIQAVTTREDTVVKKDKRKKAEEEAEEDEEEEDNVAERKEEELHECVFVMVGDRAKQVKVSTGIQNTRYIEILEGLAEGDKVISGPYTIVSKRLDHDDKVKKIKKKDLYSKKKKKK